MISLQLHAHLFGFADIRVQSEVSDSEGVTTDTAEPAQTDNDATVKRRRSYNLKFKLACLDAYAMHQRDFGGPAREVVADMFNVAPTLLSQWKANEQTLRQKVAVLSTGLHGKVSRVSASVFRAAHDKAEKVLHREFLAARSAGRPVSGLWLRTRMRQLVNSPDFKASAGWLRGFCRRYNLSFRKKTNGKSKSLAERLPQIRQWHRSLLRRLQEDIQSDPVWGRWPPARRFNVDQVHTVVPRG